VLVWAGLASDSRDGFVLNLNHSSIQEVLIFLNQALKKGVQLACLCLKIMGYFTLVQWGGYRCAE
jgi:hypothetical protein